MEGRSEKDRGSRPSPGAALAGEEVVERGEGADPVPAPVPSQHVNMDLACQSGTGA